MKKVIMFLCAVAFVAVLAGCGSEDDQDCYTVCNSWACSENCN